MKLRKLSLLISLILIMLTVNVNALETEQNISVPSFVHGNTVKAKEFTNKERKAYSTNGNVSWTGFDFDTDYKKGTISVKSVVKNGLRAYETLKYYDANLEEQDNYSAVGYRLSYGATDTPNYTAALDTAGVHEFGFEVTYFDSSEMAGNWLLVYKTWQTGNNQYGHYGMPLVQYEGTDTWKRHRWTHDYGSDLSKWSFWSDQEERVDFKFYNVEGTIGSTTVNKDNATVGAAYIHDFTMLPIDEFNEYCAKTSDNYLTAEFGGVISYGMESNIAGYNKDGGTVGKCADRYGANILAGREVTFSAPETTLSGAAGAIVVECYAAEETKITITDGENIRRVVHTGGLWQRLSFLRDEILTDEYTLTADNNISIASIHYEATDEEIPPYDTEEELPGEDEEIPVNDADIITFLEPTASSDGTNTTVTYRLTSAPEGKKAVLVATYVDPGTEEILAINSAEFSDVSQVENRRLTVTLPDKTAQGGVLRHYLWESLTDVAPLGNYSPAAPDGITAEISGASVALSWNNPQDDFDLSTDLTYGIYDSGMLLADGITGKQTELSGLIPGEDYYFSVTATDTMGAESKLSKEIAGSVKMNNIIVAGTDAVGTSSPQRSEDGNLMFVGAVDTKTYYNAYKPSEVCGLTAYESIERLDDSGNVREGLWSRIPFRIEPNYANTLKGNNVDKIGFEVVYFDSAELAGYYLNTYVSWGSADSTNVNKYGSAGYIPFTGSNSWKLYRGSFDLAGGWLAPNESNPTRGNPHFEFYTVKGTTGSDRDITPGAAIVHSLTVLPIDEFNEYVASSGALLSVKEGAVISGGITSDIDGAYVENGVTKHERRFGADVSANETIAFTVEDSSLIGSGGSVVVCCYAENETNITIGAETKVHSGKGWQKLKFDQMSIVRAYTLTADKAISINSVRVTAD